VEQKPAGTRGEKDIGVEVLDGLLAIEPDRFLNTLASLPGFHAEEAG